MAELRTCGNGLAFIDTDEVRLSFVLTLILSGIGKFAICSVNSQNWIVTCHIDILRTS